VVLNIICRTVIMTVISLPHLAARANIEAQDILARTHSRLLLLKIIFSRI